MCCASLVVEVDRYALCPTDVEGLTDAFFHVEYTRIVSGVSIKLRCATGAANPTELHSESMSFWDNEVPF